MVTNLVDSTELENKNFPLLSKEPSEELLSILNEFKTLMVKPTELFGRLITQARKENLTDEDISILLSSRQIKKLVPSGSMDYYKKKFGLSTNLAKSQLRKLHNKDTEQKDDAELPPHQEPEPIQPIDLGELSIRDDWQPHAEPIKEYKQKENEEFKKVREEKEVIEELIVLEPKDSSILFHSLRNSMSTWMNGSITLKIDYKNKKILLV